MPNAVRLTASSRPNGMPTIIAAMNPPITRKKLMYQLFQ